LTIWVVGEQRARLLGHVHHLGGGTKVLLVWIYTTVHPPGGSWQGGSAIVAGRRLRAAYWEGWADDRGD
jgi:hypothetical protein